MGRWILLKHFESVGRRFESCQARHLEDQSPFCGRGFFVLVKPFTFHGISVVLHAKDCLGIAFRFTSLWSPHPPFETLCVIHSSQKTGAGVGQIVSIPKKTGAMLGPHWMARKSRRDAPGKEIGENSVGMVYIGRFTDQRKGSGYYDGCTAYNQIPYASSSG